MFKKEKLWIMGLLIVIIAVGGVIFTLFKGGGKIGKIRQEKKSISVDTLHSKMKEVFFSSIGRDDLKTLVFDIDILDQNSNLKFYRTQYFKKPDMMKVVTKDVETGKDYVFIFKGEKWWFSEENPFLITDALVQRIAYSFLFDKEDRRIKLSGQVSSVDFNGIPCFLLTHRYDFRIDTRFKIVTYVNSSTFDCLKVEIYYLYMGDWRKVSEIFFEDITDMDGIRVARRSVMHVYSPEGEYTLKGYINSVQVNPSINDNLFDFK